MADELIGRGRADLHIHTVASDGTASVSSILDHVERRSDLDASFTQPTKFGARNGYAGAASASGRLKFRRRT